jgi:cell division septation protein DedD
MEPALKQRLIGAAVLVALAVIFLPMLIKGPAPASGASDVPLTLPDAPQGQFETRELPLVAPGDAPKGGVVGMETPKEGERLPTVDTAAAAPAATNDGMQPAAVAGGDYAVSFGSYATAADAQRVVKALQTAQLPGYQETTRDGGRTLYRVRIGPYASQAEAEAARLESTKVRGDVAAKVVNLDADVATSAPALASAPKPASVSAPVPLNATTSATTSASKPVALPAEPTKPTPTPVTAKPKPAEPKPAAPVATAAEPARPTRPAAADVGFAVQLGAFGNTADANKLRDRARASGFSAFVEQVRTDKGMLNRVRIGPVVSRAEADQLKTQVAAKLGIDGIVRPHP